MYKHACIAASDSLIFQCEMPHLMSGDPVKPACVHVYGVKFIKLLLSISAK